MGKISILFLLFSLLTIFNFDIYGQTLTLILKDKVTDQPVEYAHVQIRSMKGSVIEKAISDASGKCTFTTIPPAIVTISCLGFKPFSDTLMHAGIYKCSLLPEFYQLDRVVVTGQFRPQPVDKSIYKIDIIDSRTMGLKAANNLGDLMKNELSFQYRTEGVLGDFLRIRGLTGEHVKILIDGMPVTGRVADRLELGQLSLHNVDHIEYIEGPMSVVYGSNALAGAINIITAGYEENSFLAETNAYFETVGIYNINASVSRKYANHVFSINGARNFHSGWGPVDTSRNKIWKPKLHYMAGGKYSYHHKQLTLQLQSDFMTEELRDQDSLSLENLYEKALDGYHFTTRWNNRLSLVNQYHEDFILNLQAGYSYYKKRKITYLNDLVNLEKTPAENPDLHDTTLFHLISTRGFVSNKTGRIFEYQTGFDVSYEAASGKRTQGNQQITDAALFMNFILHPFELLSLQPGIRYIYNSDFKAPLIYAFNVKVRPGKFILRASYAKGFRAPSLKQLYLEFTDNIHDIHGNTDLKPETGNSINFSIDYSIKKGKQAADITLNAYYNSIQNAIQLVIDTAQPGWATYLNIQDNNLTTQGIESSLKYYLFPRLTLGFGANLTGRSRISDPDQFVYSTDFVSSARYQSPRYNYELALFYKYNDDYLEFAGNFNPDGGLDGIAERFVSHYHSLDFTLSKIFPLIGLTVTTGIKNLFDVTLVDSYGNLNLHGSDSQSTPAEYGRTWFIQLKYRFEKDAL